MLALILAAAVATADPSSATSPPVPLHDVTVTSRPVGGRGGRDGVICNREAPLGTHLTSLVCSTAVQRQTRERVVQHFVQDLEDTDGLQVGDVHMASGAPRAF